MDNQLLWYDFYQEINQPEIDLARACLCFAQAEYPELEPQEYLQVLDTIAGDIEVQLPDERYPLKVIQTINHHLFDTLGFRGNKKNYYDPDNSFLHQVLKRKLGIPISLSVVYLAIAQRLNFPMVGIGLPGHFLIRPEFDEAGIFVDAFNCGEILFKEDCQLRLDETYRQKFKLTPNLLEPVSNRQILARILNNLKFIYLHRREINKALGTMSAILKLNPDKITEIRDRGLLYYQLNRWSEAIIDLEYYLKVNPCSEDIAIIEVILAKINRVS